MKATPTIRKGKTKICASRKILKPYLKKCLAYMYILSKFIDVLLEDTSVTAHAEQQLLVY